MKAYLRITKQRCKPLAAEIFQKSPKTMQLSVNNIFSFRFPGEDCDVPARWCAIPPRLSQNHRCKNRSRCGCLTISLARFKESRDGAVAQLVERIVRNDEVRGSIPLGSTILPDRIVNLARRISPLAWRRPRNVGSFSKTNGRHDAARILARCPRVQFCAVCIRSVIRRTAARRFSRTSPSWRTLRNCSP